MGQEQLDIPAGGGMASLTDTHDQSIMNTTAIIRRKCETVRAFGSLTGAGHTLHGHDQCVFYVLPFGFIRNNRLGLLEQLHREHPVASTISS